MVEDKQQLQVMLGKDELQSISLYEMDKYRKVKIVGRKDELQSISQYKMDKYRKVKIVGKGSFGYAVLVESKKSHKQYIMKIIDISKMDQKQIEEALMEVHLLKVMRYPYVVTYRESFMEKMCLCIVMDYCQGGDMFHKIAQQKELGVLFPENQIVTWLVQMALSMNYVHDKKILHRDLKTQNIFLTSKGDIKLGDFGIARVLQHTYDCANTAIGTPYYLSPEICQEKPYNQKSDIWSLGCIFYQIATLNHAFDAQNMKGLVQKILKGTYPPLPDVYSADLKKLLSEMLIKDPNKRPSIKKILQMPLMKARINQLFSNTIRLHELKLDADYCFGKDTPKENSIKENSIKENSIKENSIKENKHEEKKHEEKKSKDKQTLMLKKRDENSKDKKIEVVSKNSSVLGFRKKPQEYSRVDANCKPLIPKLDNSRLGDYSRPNQISSRPESKMMEPTGRPLEKRDENKMRASENWLKEGRKQRKTPVKEEGNTARSIHKEHKTKEEQSVYEEEETLQEQGYGLLLRDMKRCIKGEHPEESNKGWKVEKVAPKYLKLETVPGVGQKDSIGTKIEALRAYLQKEIGDRFYDVYKVMQEEKEDDYASAKRLLGEQKAKFIPLIVQLIVCEDNYY